MTTVAVRSDLSLACSRKPARIALPLLLALALGAFAPGVVQAQGEKAPKIRALYQRYCQKCHGEDGKGTAAARRQLPDIPDFTNGKWQARRSDDQLLTGILDGKGIAMPAFQDKFSKAQARGLVAEVRRFRPAPAKGAKAKEGFDQRFGELQEELIRLQREFQKLHGSARRADRPLSPSNSRALRPAPADGIALVFLWSRR
jgi:mono/diheme cytochrome c family protein